MKICKNFDYNCLILLDQKHRVLSSNNFVAWNKVMQIDDVMLNLFPLNIRKSSIIVKKSSIIITNQNIIILFNITFPQSSYPFMSQYSFGYLYESSYSSYISLFIAQSIVPSTSSIIPRQILRSSLIDLISDAFRNVSSYMNWIIENNPLETEAFKEIKAILIIIDVDLGIIKILTRTDYLALDIQWNLEMRLKRDIGLFLEFLK